ncbi:hypothetical protein NDU88_001782 [Pleurodeles waltl]|uniref:Uncharacterized protein n=1 Tax=Pleurodeles waltl TaxID=8319 RepID=A0AAV7MKR3_PLEWA|nr:hypothetical protein NDU88_001782 [Pleurodeles waltl]
MSHCAHHPGLLQVRHKCMDTPVQIRPTLSSNLRTPTGAKKQEGARRCLLGTSALLCWGGASFQHSGFLQENLRDRRAH